MLVKNAKNMRKGKKSLRLIENASFMVAAFRLAMVTSANKIRRGGKRTCVLTCLKYSQVCQHANPVQPIENKDPMLKPLPSELIERSTTIRPAKRMIAAAIGKRSVVTMMIEPSTKPSGMSAFSSTLKMGFTITKVMKSAIGSSFLRKSALDNMFRLVFMDWD